MCRQRQESACLCNTRTQYEVHQTSLSTSLFHKYIKWLHAQHDFSSASHSVHITLPDHIILPAVYHASFPRRASCIKGDQASPSMSCLPTCIKNPYKDYSRQSQKHDNTPRQSCFPNVTTLPLYCLKTFTLPSDQQQSNMYPPD